MIRLEFYMQYHFFQFGSHAIALSHAMLFLAIKAN